MNTVLGNSDPAEGFRLFGAGKREDAERVFREVLLEGDLTGAGHYGMALIYLSRQQSNQAQNLLLTCLRIQPRHAHANFYLGNLSHKQGNTDEAIRFYRRALEISPSHDGATRELKRLGAATIASVDGPPKPPSPQLTPPSSTVVSGNDLYALLRRSREPVEVEISQHLDTISTIIGSRKRRPSAFLGSFIAITLLWLAMSVLSLRMGAAGIVVLLLGPAIIVLIRVNIRSMHLSVDRDFLIIKTGVLSEDKKQANIFIVSRAEVSSHRSLLNRITDNGTLILSPDLGLGKSVPHRLRLFGFFTGKELNELSSAFRRLSLLQPVSRDILSAIGMLNNVRTGTS